MISPYIIMIDTLQRSAKTRFRVGRDRLTYYSGNHLLKIVHFMTKWWSGSPIKAMLKFNPIAFKQWANVISVMENE